MSGERIAIVHDWLVVHGGAEKVLDELLAVFPEADLFALLCQMPDEPPRTYRGRPVRTSYIQRLPGGVTQYRRYLPLFPHAIESLDLSGYDVVISSSYCVAKGVPTSPRQLHLSYCYSPVRYAWDLRDQYLETSGFRGPTRWLAERVLERLRRWDAATAGRPHAYLTLSQHIAARIERAYGRPSTVVYPPVSLEDFSLSVAPRRGFVTASRLVPYKLVPMIVRAFAGMPEESLTVIGDGPDLEACRRAAASAPNVRILGFQPQEVLREALQGAEAFVFAALEDFGITPLEAQSCGTPVLAFGEGGARETVVDGVTGAFFPRQDERAIQDAVRAFRAHGPYNPVACRANAERFTSERFRAGIREALARVRAERA